MLKARIHFISDHCPNWRVISIAENSKKEWVVSRMMETPIDVSHSILFIGQEKMEAELIFMSEFDFWISERFFVDNEECYNREQVFEMFHSSMERDYVEMLGKLGYDISGEWSGGTYYRGQDNSIDELGISIRKNIMEGRI